MIRQVPGAIAVCLAATTLVGCGRGGVADGPNPQRANPSETTEGAPERAPSCAELAGVIERIECFADRAVEAGDASVCKQTDEEAVRLQCLAVFAERRGAPEACREIPTPSPEHLQLRDTCLADVAPVIRRPEICDEVETPGLKDGCYLAVARATGDSDLCRRIEDPALQSLCTGEVVHVD